VDEDVARVGKALAPLDPWSFWVVPTGSRTAVDYSVVGTTGAFVVATCALEGFAEPSALRLKVGGRSVPGLWKVRRAARKLANRLLASIVEAPVQPVVCLTRARYPGPSTVRGVRVVSIDDLATDIANRRKVLQPNRARKAAQDLEKDAVRSRG
jgi:hypothetical protein